MPPQVWGENTEAAERASPQAAGLATPDAGIIAAEALECRGISSRGQGSVAWGWPAGRADARLAQPEEQGRPVGVPSRGPCAEPGRPWGFGRSVQAPKAVQGRSFHEPPREARREVRRPRSPRLPGARGDPDLRTGPQALALSLCVVLGALCALPEAPTVSPEMFQHPWDLGEVLRQLWGGPVGVPPLPVLTVGLGFFIFGRPYLTCLL